MTPGFKPFTILFSVDHMQSVRASASKHPIDYKRKYLGIKRMVKQLVFVCIIFYFSNFFLINQLFSNLSKKSNLDCIICTIHVNNNRQLIYTLITVQSEVKRNQKSKQNKKRMFTYFVYGEHRKSITIEESFTE